MKQNGTVIKNNHESIVDPQMSNAYRIFCGGILELHQRNRTVFPLAGVVFCPDCHRPMCRRTVARGKKTLFVLCLFDP